MELFVTIVNALKLLTTFAKESILGVCQGSDYAFVIADVFRKTKFCGMLGRTFRSVFFPKWMVQQELRIFGEFQRSYYLKCLYDLQILKNRFLLNIRAASTFSSIQKWMILTQVLQVVYFWHGCRKSSSRISRSSKVIHSLGHLTFGSLQITGFGGACVGGGATLTAKTKAYKHLWKHQNLMQKINIFLCKSWNVWIKYNDIYNR